MTTPYTIQTPQETPLYFCYYCGYAPLDMSELEFAGMVTIEGPIPDQPHINATYERSYKCKQNDDCAVRMTEEVV